MGRKRRTKLRLFSQKKKCKIVTNEQPVSIMSAPHPNPTLPVRVYRTMARRAAALSRKAKRVARPIFSNRETELSGLYDTESPELYMDQVFNSIIKIGQGCFADVFQARSREDGNLYAVKVTNDKRSYADLSEVTRFEKVLDHKNCVKFYQAWQQRYRLYIKMELCMTSLDKLMTAATSLTEHQCWDVIADIGSALKHLHDHQLIHLDIKPANIMISGNGTYKLGDFGLLLDLSEEATTPAKDLTKIGLRTSEGDAKYVAVEVLSDCIYTPAGDIFSFGLTLLEASTNVNLPSRGTAWQELRNGVLPKYFTQKDLSDEFKHLVDSMMNVKFTERPTADQILAMETVQKALHEHEQGVRPSCVALWEPLWQANLQGDFCAVFPFVMLDVAPAPMSMHYLSDSSLTPSSAANLEAANSGSPRAGPSGIGGSPVTAPGQDRTTRVRRISRRLLF